MAWMIELKKQGHENSNYKYTSCVPEDRTGA